MAGFESGLFQRLFKGYIFCFLVHSDGPYIFKLPARETNLMKKRSVWVGKQYCVCVGGGAKSAPLAEIDSTDLPKPGWAIVHSAHPSPTPLFYKSILIFRISLILCEF